MAAASFDEVRFITDQLKKLKTAYNKESKSMNSMIAKRYAETTDKLVKARQSAIVTAEINGYLIRVESVVQIRDEIMTLLDNTLSSRVAEHLGQYGVPDDFVSKLYDDFYDGLAEIFDAADQSRPG